MHDEVAIDNFYVVKVARELRQCGLVTDMYGENSLIREWVSWAGWHERLDNLGVLHGGNLQGCSGGIYPLSKPLLDVVRREQCWHSSRSPVASLSLMASLPMRGRRQRSDEFAPGEQPHTACVPLPVTASASGVTPANCEHQGRLPAASASE